MLVQLLSVASDFINTAVWCKMQTITTPKGGQGIHSDVSPLAVAIFIIIIHSQAFFKVNLKEINRRHYLIFQQLFCMFFVDMGHTLQCGLSGYCIHIIFVLQ